MCHDGGDENSDEREVNDVKGQTENRKVCQTALDKSSIVTDNAQGLWR